MCVAKESLRITIATAPDGSTSLAGDLRLIRAAIVYGDQVTLCSPTASMMAQLAGFTRLSTADQSKLTDEMIEEKADARTLACLQYLRAMRSKKHKNRDELLTIAKAEQITRDAARGMSDKIERLVTDAGGDAIGRAMDAGILDLHPLDLSSEDATLRDFFNVVVSSVSGGTTYPLLDAQTNTLVRSAVSEGTIPSPGAGADLSKIVGLALDVFSRLPTFDDTSIDYLLALRKELSDALVRFRSAIARFAEVIRCAQWDADFAAEAELVFRRDVAPAVLDLEMAFRQNSLARNLVETGLGKPSHTIIGAAIGALADIASLSGYPAAALGVGVGTASAAATALRTRAIRDAELKGNQLYFYYALKRSFS